MTNADKINNWLRRSLSNKEEWGAVLAKDELRIIERIAYILDRVDFEAPVKVPPEGKVVMVQDGADSWVPAVSSGEVDGVGYLMDVDGSIYPDWRPMTDDEIWNGEEE